MKLSKEYWKNISCMALQDLIKYKGNEIIRYKGLSEVLEKAEIIPSNHEIKDIMSNLSLQSKEHEISLKIIAKSIKCEFIMER